MQTVFDDILMKGIRAGQAPARTVASRNWYRNVAKTAGQPNMADKTRVRKTVEPGSMYMFHYDPKTKDKLPYYDRFPLIFPFESAPGGFYGINLHYLPHRLRARLMDGLYKYTSDKRYDEKTKLAITYRMLKGAANLKYFKPCVKRYLYSHVQSPFLYVFAAEWDVALFMPTEKFAKQSMSYVHDKSTKMIYGTK